MWPAGTGYPASRVDDDDPLVYTMRDLNQEPARIISEIETAGKPAFITRHGRFVAMITPLALGQVESQVLAEMAREIGERTAGRPATGLAPVRAGAADQGALSPRSGREPLSEQRLAIGCGNTSALARRPGRRTARLERGLDGGGDEPRGLRVDDDVPAEQNAADDLPGMRGRVVRADGGGLGHTRTVEEYGPGPVAGHAGFATPFTTITGRRPPGPGPAGDHVANRSIYNTDGRPQGNGRPRGGRGISASGVLDGVGRTEMLSIFVSSRPGAVRPGATGVAVPGSGGSAAAGAAGTAARSGRC